VEGETWTFAQLTGGAMQPMLRVRFGVIQARVSVESEDIREWNERVRRLADMLTESADTRFGFICQCGCGEVVPLTAATFDADGGWVEGHKPGSPPGAEFHLPAA
jgi:hypothetical protein